MAKTVIAVLALAFLFAISASVSSDIPDDDFTEESRSTQSASKAAKNAHTKTKSSSTKTITTTEPTTTTTPFPYRAPKLIVGFDQIQALFVYFTPKSYDDAAATCANQTDSSGKPGKLVRNTVPLGISMIMFSGSDSGDVGKAIFELNYWYQKAVKRGFKNVPREAWLEKNTDPDDYYGVNYVEIEDDPVRITGSDVSKHRPFICELEKYEHKGKSSG